MQAPATAATATAVPFDQYNPSEEHLMLRRTVHDFAEREVEPQALESDRSETFNRALFNRAGELGLLAITVPEAWGGAGLDATAAVIMAEEICWSDPGLGISVLAHGTLFVHNLYTNGNDEQRARFLPKTVTGEKLAGLCMTEPDSGTDVLGMKTRAVRDGDVYKLTGRKMFITNGYVDAGESGGRHETGDCYIVYAKTGDEISSFVVEKGMPGFSLGQRLKDKTGLRASTTAELVFDDVPVPLANRLGEEGDSTIHMMRNLELERLVIAAMSLGMARRCLEIMNRYASERKAYGKPINSFGQIQRHIAESYTEYMVGRSFVYELAHKIQLDKPGHRMETDAAKLFTATMAKNVADRAMQVLGGYGYFGESVVERLWRAAKLNEIGGGTLEAHHKNITRDLARHPEAIR
ncbi:MAG: acyl-CoA dehydrogenase family protein [SAR324 cluster bacterium]|nr:acyl-CoA dehydrogenase family protein [SAR324 cluster bacterium]